jgi:hypothetical protein
MTAAGPVAIEIEPQPNGWRWSVHARTTPIAVDAVALVWRAGPADDTPRFFANGYQSWAPSRTFAVGVDEDPSRDTRTLELVRAAMHADPAPASPGELRSEQVALLALDPAPRSCIGFAGGASHAGTIRARIVDAAVEVCAEAWLGGAEVGSEPRRCTTSLSKQATTQRSCWNNGPRAPVRRSRRARQARLPSAGARGISTSRPSMIAPRMPWPLAPYAPTTGPAVASFSGPESSCSYAIL